MQKIKKILIVELACLFVLSSGLVTISSARTIDRYNTKIVASLSEVDFEGIRKSTKKDVKKAKNEFVHVADDTVWTTSVQVYRNGPDKGYKKAGSLQGYQKLHRTGTTKGGWSRVVIDDKEYFVRTEFVTTQEPEMAKGDLQEYAQSLLSDYGWDKSEITPLIKLWNRESGWKPSAHNRYSGAHGIPQALPASKMASEGSDYMTNGKTQIRWGLGYIKNRYGSPSKAWAHSEATGWY